MGFILFTFCFVNMISHNHLERLVICHEFTTTRGIGTETLLNPQILYYYYNPGTMRKMQLNVTAFLAENYLLRPILSTST